MLLILLLWLKANTECTFTMSECATSRGGTGPSPAPLPGWRLIHSLCRCDSSPWSTFPTSLSILSAERKGTGIQERYTRALFPGLFCVLSIKLSFLALLYRNFQQTDHSGSEIPFLSTDNYRHILIYYLFLSLDHVFLCALLCVHLHWFSAAASPSSQLLRWEAFPVILCMALFSALANYQTHPPHSLPQFPRSSE